MLCVGLFGTCGKSIWRERVIQEYNELGISYFNPQVADWKPELAVEEARHLAEDQVILFPVTGETYGLGSLAETGFSIVNALRLDDYRDFVIIIEMALDPSLSDKGMREESLRGRRLVTEHLKKLCLSNLYVVNTLDEMLEVSIALYQAAALKAPYAMYNPHRRQGGILGEKNEKL